MKSFVTIYSGNYFSVAWLELALCGKIPAIELKLHFTYKFLEYLFIYLLFTGFEEAWHWQERE